MNRYLCGWVALGLLVGGVGEATGQPSYVYTTIDVPASSFFQPNAINNSGQIVGSYNDPLGMQHGFLLSGGSYTTLDVPGSTATTAHAINAAGQIVGEYRDALGATHGFLLSGAGYTRLDPPGSANSIAYGINASGQVVGGYATVPFGFFEGYLLNGGH